MSHPGGRRHASLSRRRRSRRALEPLRFVDDVAQRFAAPMPADIVEQDFEVAFGDPRRIAGDVRRQDRVLHAPERVIGRERLGLVNVQRGARDQPLVQRLRQRREIDDGAAAAMAAPRAAPRICAVWKFCTKIVCSSATCRTSRPSRKAVTAR